MHQQAVFLEVRTLLVAEVLVKLNFAQLCLLHDPFALNLESLEVASGELVSYARPLEREESFVAQAPPKRAVLANCKRHILLGFLAGD